MGRHREFDTEAALDAALGVFWRKGYEGASYDDLSAATRVARPGLYAAFGNKQALFLKALDRYDSLHMGFMREALEAPTSRQVVERILLGSAAVQTRNPDSPGCLGLNGALACSDDAEPVRQELIRRRAGTQAALERRLERAKAEVDLPASAQCDVLAGFVMAVSQGMAVQAKAGAGRDALREIVRHVLATWPSPAG